MELLRLKPTELLDVGKEVMVDGRGKATVTKAEWKNDQHGKPICVHTLRYEKTGKEQTCNYAFIRYKV